MKEQYSKYTRTGIAEMRPVTKDEIKAGTKNMVEKTMISISSEDSANGSPKKGDMVARNPQNPQDKWLVASKYFQDNFELKENK